MLIDRYEKRMYEEKTIACIDGARVRIVFLPFHETFVDGLNVGIHNLQNKVVIKSMNLLT